VKAIPDNVKKAIQTSVEEAKAAAQKKAEVYELSSHAMMTLSNRLNHMKGNRQGNQSDTRKN
jgi:hypothetical protein